MYSLGHRLRTLRAVPRSTQPSTLRISFGLGIIRNGDSGCGMVDAIYIGGLTAHVSCLGLGVGGHPGAQPAFSK